MVRGTVVGGILTKRSKEVLKMPGGKKGRISVRGKKKNKLLAPQRGEQCIKRHLTTDILRKNGDDRNEKKGGSIVG